jgi:hypothetical protein
MTMTMTEPASRGTTLVLPPDVEATFADVNSAGAIANEPMHDVGDRHVLATVAEPNGNVPSLLWGRP